MVLPNIVEPISVEQARSLFSYDHETGVLTYKHRDKSWFSSERPWRKFNTQFAGKAAGSIAGNGYRRVMVSYKEILGHRLAWAIFYGQWPAFEIDHKNRVRCDNAISNLRPCTAMQNSANKSLSALNTSGFKGVSLDTRLGRWRAGIESAGKCHFLGNYENAEDAADAYETAAKSMLGEFAFAAKGSVRRRACEVQERQSRQPEH